MAHKLLPVRKVTHSYSSVFKGRFLKKQLLKESTMVANDSLAVLGEFERFEKQFSFEESSRKNHGSKRT